MPRKKNVIERAYQLAEACGLPLLWNQDEAGPYATQPQPGASWHLQGHPKLQSHEYLRDGGAKLMTLFRPATGEVRAKGVRSVTNAVLHPWLQEQLLSILESEEEARYQEDHQPAPLEQTEVAAHCQQWETWLGWRLSDRYPPLRMILVWDNLAGHRSDKMVSWLFAHGIIVLATWGIRSNDGPVVPDEGSFLAKAPEMGVQSTGSMLRVRSDHAPIFTKTRFYLCCVCFPRSSDESASAFMCSKNVFCVGLYLYWLLSTSVRIKWQEAGSSLASLVADPSGWMTIDDGKQDGVCCARWLACGRDRRGRIRDRRAKPAGIWAQVRKRKRGDQEIESAWNARGLVASGLKGI
jgi:hypothetical protein